MKELKELGVGLDPERAAQGVQSGEGSFLRGNVSDQWASASHISCL